MSDSTITKAAIAKGLKEICQTKSFDKISIADITKSCGLNRQTFYYHFQDKYELLSWIYYQDVFEKVIEGISLENWPDRICGLLTDLLAEKVFYMNSVKSEENCFQSYLFQITNTLFYEAIHALDENEKLLEEEKHFYSEFFTYGICGMIIAWVKSGMKEEPQKMASQLKQLVEHSEKLAYERYQQGHGRTKKEQQNGKSPYHKKEGLF